MASSRCGGSTANGGKKLAHATKPSWYAACEVVSGHAMVGSRSRVDRGALPARWPSEFRSWSVTVVVGERCRGERGKTGERNPKAMGFFFPNLLFIIFLKKNLSSRTFKKIIKIKFVHNIRFRKYEIVSCFPIYKIRKL